MMWILQTCFSHCRPLSASMHALGAFYPIHVQCIFRRLRFLSVPVFALTGSSLSLLAGIYWLSFVRMAGIAEQMRAGKPRQHPDSIQSVLQEFTS